jgi:tetratricopeptide (TPR) repeat protein
MPTQSEGEEFLKFEIEPAGQPEPVDYNEELAATNALLDLCESEQFDPWGGSLHPADTKVTPWVALQLGCAAEFVASQGDLLKSFKIAALGVRIAIALKSPSRLYANLLTLSGVLLRSGRMEEAELRFSQILELPYPGGEREKASAHVSLGSIYKRKGKTREAIYHYERGLVRLRQGKLLSSAAYLATLKTYAYLYAETQDIAGLLHCSSQIDPGTASEGLGQLEFEKMSVDDALLLTSRLYSLQEPELADSLFKLWHSHHTGKEGPDE